MKRNLLIVLLIVALVTTGFCFGASYASYSYEKTTVKPVIREIEKEVQTTVYRYPNTPPYEAFPDPIDFDQALVLLYGMRASHIQALAWEFESDPGFGIADKDLQRQFIKWYDQLIDIFWRMER